MPKTPRTIALICGLFAVPLACSASDPGPSAGAAGARAAGGGANPSAGSPGSAGSSAAGSNSAGAGLGGSPAAAGSPSGGTSASAGAGGSTAGATGSAGGPNPTCVSGTGTMPVGDKSVLDRKTCLTWTKTRTAMTLTNKAAAKYCASLSQDGIDNWRVPHPEELVTWPDLATDGTAYITGPVYVPTTGTEQDGCTGNSHSCNIAKYNDASVTCAWQGVGFAGWVECVSGAPAAGTTNPAYAAATCSPCNGEQATFKETDCSQYTN